MADTFRTMTAEHLGAHAPPQDLALFQSACLILVDEQGYSDSDATEYVWNDGDWYGRACDIVGATR